MTYQWQTVLGYWPQYLHAALLALRITVLAFILATACATVAALARNSSVWLLRLVAGVYVEVIRNTPVLLQIFIVFFALPSFGLHFHAVTAGILALGFNVGAYMCEVFRAGIASVSRGQSEAAQILGLSARQTFAFVVVPQALRNVYPATVNNLLQVLLGTSLLTAIAVPEITGVATVINARTLLFVQVFLMALLLYLVLSNLLSLAAAVVGRVIFRPPLRAASVGPRLPRMRRQEGADEAMVS